MLRLVCKYDAKIVFKHMRVLCGKNCIGGIPGNDFGEEFVAPQEAPIVYKLEAYGFQIGIVVRNLINILTTIMRQKQRILRNFFHNRHNLRNRIEKGFPMKFLIIGQKP